MKKLLIGLIILLMTLLAASALASPAAPVVNIEQYFNISNDVTFSIVKGEGVEYYEITATDSLNLFNFEQTVDAGSLETGEELHLDLSARSATGTISGEYVLQVTAYDDDDNPSPTVIKNFTVYGTLPNTPGLTVNKTDFVAGDYIVFNVTAPGAEKLEYLVSGDSGIRTAWVTNETDTGLSYTLYVYNKGDFSYVFRAFVDDEWTPWSAPVQVSVRFLGKLDTPQISFPATVRAGEPVPITMDPNMPDFVTLNIRIIPDDDPWYDFLYLSSGSQYLYEQGFIEAGTYQVEYSAYAYKYEESEPAVATIVVTGVRPDPPEATLSTTEAHHLDTVWVTVSGPGLEAATAYNAWYSSTVGPVFMATNGTVRIPVQIVSWSETTEIRVRGRVDGCWSEEIGLELTVLEDEDYYEIMIPEASVPSTAQCGQPFTFTLAPLVEADFCTAGLCKIEDDDDIQLSEDGMPMVSKTRCILYEYILEPDGSGRCSLPAWCFIEEGDYLLNLRCHRGVYGYDSYGMSSYYIIRATAAAVTPPVARLTTGTPLVNSEVSFQVTGTGAQQFCAFIYRDYDLQYCTYYEPELFQADQNGSATYVIPRLKEEGTYYAYFTACVNGVWSDLSEPVIFDTIAYGCMETPTFVEAPAEVPFGVPVTLSWAALENATQYIVTVGAEGQGSILSESFPASTTSFTFTVSSDQFTDENEWVGYYVVDAFGEGLGTSGNTYDPVTFVDPATEPTLRALGDELVEVRASTGDIVRFQIDNHDVLCVNASLVNGKQTISLTGLSNGAHTVRASMGRVVPSYDGIHWSTWSNAVTVQGTGNTPTLKLPADLTAVAAEAFRYTKASRVIVPDGCTSIGAYAFADCENLQTVIIPASVTSIDGNAFYNSGALTFITPSGSTAESFANSRGWTVRHE